MHAAQQRDLFMQDIAARDELAACITNVPPKSLYARWLSMKRYNFSDLEEPKTQERQTKTCSAVPGIGLSSEPISSKHPGGRPLSENLLLLNQIARTRNIIALNPRI
jgi:hypothetical protein